MPFYSMEKRSLAQFLSSLLGRRELIAPLKRGPVSSFEKIGDPSELKLLNLESLPNYPPKKFFFEDWQTLYRYRNEKGKMHVEVPELPKNERVLFGVRGCDSNALLVCDDIFLGQREDIYYKANRDRTIVIGLECSHECAYGFCSSVNHCDFRKFDLLFYESGDRYLIEAGSKRGEHLVSEYSKFFKPAPGAKKPKKNFTCAKPFPFEKIQMNKKNLAESGRTCFSCQGCATICPTCTCFDILDLPEPNGGGKKVRIWETCLDPHFSMISGACFRSERAERVEHFDLHKLKFHRKRFGRQMCVGCGRCIWVCLAGIDITKNVEPESKGK